ncbi:MAG: hypothetical protein PUD44_06675, partial [Clostridiaceae bacterium]|nr:hypothetical protein [Clostridiaceae bacterium]
MGVQVPLSAPEKPGSGLDSGFSSITGQKKSFGRSIPGSRFFLKTENPGRARVFPDIKKEEAQ